ncbi:hypothetical protein F4859DRAFT_517376 [Xylaria cf. heliscus]|nr:hypothetical protein F4859DRAFT_517376 [Xylaria cf. heliscus]
MAPSAEALEGYLEKATRQLYDEDPNTVTVNLVRQRAEEQNNLEKGFFVTQDWKARSKTSITQFVQALLANDSPSSTPELKTEEDTKHGVKRSSSDDEASSSPPSKRHKKAASATAPRNSRLKKESSSSALSELSDSDVEPKKEKNKKTKTTKKSTKQESDSELSDLDLSEEERTQKKKAKKPTASRKTKKEESESELSDLSSSEDKPKPTKKRGRKSKKLEAADDGGKDNGAGASTSRSKRKQPAAKTKRTAKRGKVESDNEDELNEGNDVGKSEADADAKTDGIIIAKAEESGEDAKPEKKESKPLANDSDSSLSSVLDEPPPKKRKGKDIKGASKSKQSTSKELTGDEAEIKKLQGQLVKCGVRKIWGIELKKYGSDGKAKLRHLRTMLRDVGMDGRFSEAKAKEIKERRELIGELEAVNEMNELWGLEGRNGRASRSKAPRKSLKEESDEGNDDDDNNNNDEQNPKAENDDEDVKVKTNSRMSKRMADLAFLGSDSESE